MTRVWKKRKIILNKSAYGYMKLINQSCKIWNFMTRRVILRTWIRYRIFNVALCLSQWKMVKKQYQQIWFSFFSLLWKEFLSSETIAGLSSQTAGFPQYSLLNFLLANFFRLYLWVRPFHPSIHPSTLCWNSTLFRRVEMANIKLLTTCQ